jgi:hypothetical protein
MRDAQMQPLRELLAKKSKKKPNESREQSLHSLGILGRMRLFKGLWRIQIKKIPALASGCGGPSQGRELLSLSGARQA